MQLNSPSESKQVPYANAMIICNCCAKIFLPEAFLDSVPVGRYTLGNFNARAGKVGSEQFSAATGGREFMVHKRRLAQKASLGRFF